MAKRMERKLEDILELLKSATITYNAQRPERFGVALGKDAVMAASSSFAITFENIGLTEQYPEFYSYLNEDFGEYAYPMSPEQIIHRASEVEFVGSATFPISNIINRLQVLEDDKVIEKCAMVFAHGVKDEDDILLSFDNKGTSSRPEMVSDLEEAGKPIYVANTSPLDSEHISEGTVYRVKERGEDSKGYYVDVIEPTGYVRMGIHYSPVAWFPEMYELANKMTGYIDPGLIVPCIGYQPEDLKMEPLHLSAPLFFNVCKALSLFDNICEIMFPKNPNKDHCIIRSIQKSSNDPIVTVYLPSKDRTAGIQTN